MGLTSAPFATDEQRSDSSSLAKLNDTIEDEVSNAVVANGQRLYLLTRDDAAAKTPNRCLS